MTHSILDLCKPHEHVAPIEDNEDHEKPAYDTTTLVHEALESALSNLDRRVLTMSNGVNLDAPFRDADMIRGSRSDLALAYVYAATIYSQQGKQRHVIDICDHGLRDVDTKDTHYAMLQRLRQDAVQRENIRIDPIKQLPYEILSTSLIRIIMEDGEPLDSSIPCPYLYVSKEWRECIIQCLGGLRFRTGHRQMENLEQWSQISIFARHIKSLCISYYCRDSWLCDLLRGNDFCMLQELIIEKDHCIMFVDDFFLSLSSVGGVLTHLRTDDIYEQPKRSDSPFLRVLLTCPNLVSLAILQRDDNYLTQLPKMTWPKVTTLAIVNAVDVFGYDEIKAMCERFPSLKQLTIDSCPDLQSTSIIHQYYPSMRSLHVTGKFPHVVLRYSDQGPQCDEPGITDLVICMDKWNRLLPDPELSLLFKQHHQTLESIKLEIHTAFDDASIYDIQYPRLKKLHLDESGWWIPRNAPMLEELCITSTTFNTHPVVLDTIPPKLKQLKLVLGDGSQLDNKSPIEGYLHRYVDHPHLRQLAIDTNNMNNINNVLDAICHLYQLQSLIFVYREWDSNQMESFFHQLVHACPDLAKLLFTCTKAPSMASMLVLKQLANLQHIGILMETLDEDQGFWEALSALTQLEHVAINGSKAANMHEIRRLKERRPDLKITLD
ncbi:hypothetical protein O0I10_006663 [Lichtheimia ornata]|uniref:F-box domain-containing protein n=1 Tax=Lichtheimia ornata TaxID=688661 RepID=A0AAD7V2J2_9FUNG|nr:uncharacterized protein O0I10_006663 [Lichtheimia ornata]KAJ8657599.1 hypothetical protein O0I10_006663 [Lichtheimia ornata]